MWVLYAILNPFSDAARGIFSKKASKNVDSFIVSWFNNLVPLIIFSPLVFFIELKFSREFFEALIISGLLNVMATILYHRSISKGDISLVMPMLSFTPLCLLIISPVIVGEFPDTRGLIGIIFIVLGSYLLNINLKKRELLTPLKSLLINKGTRYMLIVAFIYSITSSFDKKGLEASSIFQYMIFINLVVTLGITAFILVGRKFSSASIKLEWRNLLFVGLTTTATFFFHMMALSLTLVVYVIAIKRTSGMMSVAFGHIFFSELNVRERLLGAAVMFVGVLFIIL
jgi:uncharacterized membrane protein